MNPCPSHDSLPWWRGDVVRADPKCTGDVDQGEGGSGRPVTLAIRFCMPDLSELPVRTR
jgi:hypothetical protein